MALSFNMNWERRICMFPAYFDPDGLMHCDTDFGDYPHYSPGHPVKKGKFTGWMLLSYKKPVKSSSVKENFVAANVIDENAKTFWVADQNNDKQWLTIDLEKPGKVFAIQLNYFDYKSQIYGKVPGLYHQYTIEGSLDNKKWELLVDRRNNNKDVPNDYVQLPTPKTIRFIRFSNIHVPMQHLSISDIRVFGIGSGKLPLPVKNLKATRNSDRRDALIQWDSRDNCQGYLIRWGIAPDKLYSSWMVYDKNSLQLKCLTTDQDYYFAITAFNENGISDLSKVIRVP
jgi:hypothetical protein